MSLLKAEAEQSLAQKDRLYFQRQRKTREMSHGLGVGTAALKEAVSEGSEGEYPPISQGSLLASTCPSLFLSPLFTLTPQSKSLCTIAHPLGLAILLKCSSHSSMADFFMRVSTAFIK